MRWIEIRIGLVAAGLVAGCRPVDLGRPPTVRFGEEACASCRMIIADEHFAAAIVAPTGEALKFDDIGCLVEHEAGRFRPDAAYWVRDAGSGAWLDARAARFAHSPGVASPMGFGLAAHPADRASGGPDARALRLHELSGLLADRERREEADRTNSK